MLTPQDVAANQAPMLGPPVGAAGPVAAPGPEAPAAPESGYWLTNKKTGEKRFIPANAPTTLSHPEKAMHAHIDKWMGDNPMLAGAWKGAAQIVREHHGDLDYEKQLEKVAEIAGQNYDDMMAMERLKRQRQAGFQFGSGGGGGGKDLSDAARMAARKYGDKSAEEVLDDKGYVAGAQRIKDMAEVRLSLPKGKTTFAMFEKAVTAMARSMQPGVLTNQDKEPLQLLQGILGKWQVWMAKNVDPDTIVPEKLRKQLWDLTVINMSTGQQAMEEGWGSMERRYLDANADLTRAMKSGDKSAIEQAQVIRDAMATTIRARVDKSYWSDVPGLGVGASDGPGAKAADVSIDKMIELGGG
jgi:hypothetical protein